MCILRGGAQARADDKDVTPYLCGYTVGSDILSPGGEEFFTLEVDENKCGDGAWLTVVSMLGKCNIYDRESKSIPGMYYR